MSQLYSLSINHFRGIREFKVDKLPSLVCLIGRGDSGKSTVLEAINIVLSGSWNVPFYDNDFYDCDTTHPIIIEATLIGIPVELMNESRFGLYMKGFDRKNWIVVDDSTLTDEVALTIRMKVEKDLEPQWTVISNTETGTRPISAADRARLNAFLVSDYVDRHFSWGKGNPLYSLLKQELNIQNDDDDILIEVLREAKSKIDGSSFEKFDRVVSKVKLSAKTFGVDISKTVTTIDFKDIVMKDGKMSLHDNTIPFRLKGKGSKRLVSITIQALIAGNGGIVMIDEIEQGLEPDRVQHLVNTLKKNNQGQVFMTTHSRDVLVELKTSDVFLMQQGNAQLIGFPVTLQGALRKNPECFFARKVIVCEGATEIGICKALNDYRTSIGKDNMAYLGIRLADGSGSQSLEYVKAFYQSKMPVCLLCDSDAKEKKGVQAIESKKKEISDLGIKVFDWEEGDCIEAAVIKEVSFKAVVEMCELAAKLLSEQFSISITDAKTKVTELISDKMSDAALDDLAKAVDSSALRNAIALTASKHSWFKNQDKGYAWGMIICNNIADLQEGRLKKNLMALINWMDDDRL